MFGFGKKTVVVDMQVTRDEVALVRDALAKVKAEREDALKTLELLRADKRKLIEEMEDLKLRKRLEQEEVVHMQKINEERLKQQLEGEKLALAKKYQDDINKFKEEQFVEFRKMTKEFHEKMEGQFNKELNSLKEVYTMLAGRLPNVNMNIRKNITETISDQS